MQIYDPALDQWSVGTEVPNNNNYRCFGSSGYIIGDTIFYHGGAAGFNFGAKKQLRKGVINPNNPTGTWLDEQALRGFMAAVPENVVVVLDEAYCEYVDEAAYPDSIAMLADYPNLVVTRTFSKAYGLAGLRVGYAISHPDIADLLNRVRAPFNVSVPAMAAAAAAYRDHEYLQQGREVNTAGREQLVAAFDELGLPYIPSVGNFITVEMPSDAMPYYQALLEKGVIVRPIGVYGMPRHLRVSIGLEQENQRFISALKEVLAPA